MAIGAITVPAYITNTTTDHEYIIKHSGARCLILSDHNLAKKVLPAVANSPQCQLVIKVENDNESYRKVIKITNNDWARAGRALPRARNCRNLCVNRV